MSDRATLRRTIDAARRDGAAAVSLLAQSLGQTRGAEPHDTESICKPAVHCFVRLLELDQWARASGGARLDRVSLRSQELEAAIVRANEPE
ncbi:MAG: hypothetical protein AAFN41_06485, partial [Planctomycetota bacterium]